MKRIVVASHDAFEPDGSQRCTGQFYADGGASLVDTLLPLEMQRG